MDAGSVCCLHCLSEEHMTELLAPAGNREALEAAAAAGCDAVYLGMQKFGARAYSENFDEEGLRAAVEYAHLRGIKLYVTMNTIVFEDEREEMQKQLRLLEKLGVDGVIVQDLAAFEYTVSELERVELHCSTQMGIDDLEGTLLCKEMGADRVVLARELAIEEAARIKRLAQLPIEIFVHGALCVSYSGNCLMSGLIGYRSGNRGRCVGSCRKKYELVNLSDGLSLGESYLLSMKDLNTIEHIDELREFDSLKLEGRMKEAAYVANVVSQYRRALDRQRSDGSEAAAKGENEEAAELNENLKKTFNRSYTKGYLLGEDPKDISNIDRPNNYGYPIGKISGSRRGMYELSLSETLNQNDIIRIDCGGEDVNLSLVRLYDRDGRLINSAETECYIKIKEKLPIGSRVYKTKDYQFYKKTESIIGREFRFFPLNLRVYAYPQAPLVIEAEGMGCSYCYESTELLEEAVAKPTSREQLIAQLSRLGDTLFSLGELEFEECNAFIPVKLLNNARRRIVQELYAARLSRQPSKVRQGSPQSRKTIVCHETMPKPYLSASVMTREQYEACISCGIKEIYFENIIRRNQNSYEPRTGELLIGGYGGIYHYRDTNEFVSDYSFNVVNAVACRKLHELGARRVTLSHELNKRQIRALVDSYVRENGGYPALELIVYGRAPLLFTKYCPLKVAGQCGKCRSKSYELRDEYGSFPLISHSDCTTTILNGRILNLLDEMQSIEGIESFRLSFTLESASEVRSIVRAARAKLEGRRVESLFRPESDTRGHFNREIS